MPRRPVATTRGSARVRPTVQGPFSLRGWLVVVGGAATAAVILVAWLPVGALLSQRAQLSAASSRLAQLTAEQRALAAESKQLDTTQVLDQLAREQYQLVEPGQRLIQVLTPSFTPTARSEGGPFPGDPGYAPLADPDGTAGLAPSGSTASTSSTASSRATTTTHGGSSQGFVSRVLGTLEFWR